MTDSEFKAEADRIYDLLAECINLNDCDSAATACALRKIYYLACCEVNMSYEDFESIEDQMKLMYKEHIEGSKCS